MPITAPDIRTQVCARGAESNKKKVTQPSEEKHDAMPASGQRCFFFGSRPDPHDTIFQPPPPSRGPPRTTAYDGAAGSPYNPNKERKGRLVYI